jgi:hypothetical protein
MPKAEHLAGEEALILPLTNFSGQLGLLPIAMA